MKARVKRILLFDDDYASMFPLKEHLEEELGWEVELTAEKEILDRLAYEHFDLICTDLMIHSTSLNADDEEVENVHFEGVSWMKTGLELVQRLRQGTFSKQWDQGTSPQVPIIMLSAVANESVEDNFKKEITIEGYVEKPFALDLLVDRIRLLLQE